MAAFSQFYAQNVTRRLQSLDVSAPKLAVVSATNVDISPGAWNAALSYLFITSLENIKGTSQAGNYKKDLLESLLAAQYAANVQFDARDNVGHWINTVLNNLYSNMHYIVPTSTMFYAVNIGLDLTVKDAAIAYFSSNATGATDADKALFKKLIDAVDPSTNKNACFVLSEAGTEFKNRSYATFGVVVAGVSQFNVTGWICLFNYAYDGIIEDILETKNTAANGVALIGTVIPFTLQEAFYITGSIRDTVHRAVQNVEGFLIPEITVPV